MINLLIASIITVFNPSSSDRIAEPVVIPVSEQATSALVTLGDKEIPCQLDDLNDDGVFDELAFVTDIKAKETLTFSVTFSDGKQHEYPAKAYASMSMRDRDSKAKKPKHLPATSITVPASSDAFQYIFPHGPVMESELVGFRVYSDHRQAIDYYGHKSLMMDIAKTDFYPTKDQVREGSGDDVLYTGTTYGCGALMGWDGKNAIMEIRGGTGGDEAAIFAGDLFRMYSKFIEKRGWKMEVTSQAAGTAGGYKEIICTVSGDGVYGVLKYESGVHRVQRVPQTETQGRVHTSAASVVVLPEAGEFDVELNEKDIRKDIFCASGPGGQGVNTTYSAIRLTHIPTGIVVQCQDERNQLKNYEKALTELRTRLYNMEYQKYLDNLSSKRKTMVSTGDRSAKIRTYNYPQSRVTDHRINWSTHNLPVFMDGDIQEVIDQLQIAENAERLKEAQ